MLGEIKGARAPQPRERDPLKLAPEGGRGHGCSSWYDLGHLGTGGSSGWLTGGLHQGEGFTQRCTTWWAEGRNKTRTPRNKSSSVTSTERTRTYKTIYVRCRVQPCGSVFLKDTYASEATSVHDSGDLGRGWRPGLKGKTEREGSSWPEDGDAPGTEKSDL